MKFSKIAIVAAALALPAAAYALPDGAASYPTGNGPGGQVNQDNPDGFKNQGQCQAALSHAINGQRQDPTTRTNANKDKSTSEFQLFMLDRFVCLQDDDGAWKVYVAA